MKNIEEMIEYGVERGDVEFYIKEFPEIGGICSGGCGKNMEWYFCSRIDGDSIDSMGIYKSLRDLTNAKVFDGKSLADLFDVTDYSMN